MAEDSVNLELLRNEIHKDLKTHELLDGDLISPELPYARYLLSLKQAESLKEQLINFGVALELIASALRLHFTDEIESSDSLKIIKGDYLFARAVQRAIDTGHTEAIYILADAVQKESALTLCIPEKEVFVYLLVAAQEYLDYSLNTNYQKDLALKKAKENLSNKEAHAGFSEEQIKEFERILNAICNGGAEDEA